MSIAFGKQKRPRVSIFHHLFSPLVRALSTLISQKSDLKSRAAGAGPFDRHRINSFHELGINSNAASGGISAAPQPQARILEGINKKRSSARYLTPFKGHRNFSKCFVNIELY